MPEVLSQSQIDALLNSVRSGESTPEQEAAAPAEKKYRKYDFKSPRKFTKDRIKMLNGIYENYARVINSRLNAILHTNCEIGVESIEEQRYYEFSNALTDGDVLSIVEPRFRGKPLEDESPMIVYMDTTISLSMMDMMMGGEGAIDPDLPSDYAYTDLELRLYETLAKDMVNVMGTSWENYAEMEFLYTRTETNPTLVQILGLEETVVIVDMKMKFNNAAGRMSVCLPGMMLTNLFAAINRENPARRGSGEDNSEDIFNTLRQSGLEIVAQLGETQMSLNDLYHLNVGDVIDMGRPKDSPVTLEIGGQEWFTGRIGTHKKNMAVKIDDICYHAGQRSER
jgi:flagellar motor switch protein FliM